jgi:phage/plasmid-associated DNA primase
MATSNDPPNLTAYDDALKDRVKALPFVHILADGPPLRFTGAQRLEEVRRDPESPLVRGFAAWAVEGLERVYRNQAIQRAAAAEKHTRQFWADTDPLTPFWAGLEEAELRTGMITEKLRGAYIAWCDYEGIKKRLAGKAWGDACHSVGLESWRTQDARGWRIPKKAPWPYANDGMTDSGLFSEKSSIENSHVESLPKKGIIPSFRHYSVIDGTPQTKTTPAPPNSRPLPDRTGDDEALEDYEEVQY